MPTMESFKHSLFAADRTAALSEIQSEAASLRELLTKEDLVLSADQMDELNNDPQWLEAIYAALAGDETADTEADAIFADIEGRLRNEHVQLADAWQAALDRLDKVKGPKWDARLAGLQLPADDPLVKHLRQHPSVREGEKAGQRLLQYGLSPAMLQETLRGLQLLFDRTVRRAVPDEAQVLEPAGQNVFIRTSDKQRVLLSLELMQRQVASVRDMRPELVTPFGETIFTMLQTLPFLVDGYRYIENKLFEKLPEQEYGSEDGAGSRLIRRWAKQ